MIDVRHIGHRYDVVAIEPLVVHPHCSSPQRLTLLAAFVDLFEDPHHHRIEEKIRHRVPRHHATSCLGLELTIAAPPSSEVRLQRQRASS